MKYKNDKDSFYLEGCIHINSNYIKLPRIGWVKLAEKINIDSITNILGLNITFVTSAKTDEEGFALLKEFGLPFKK